MFRHTRRYPPSARSLWPAAISWRFASVAFLLLLAEATVSLTPARAATPNGFITGLGGQLQSIVRNTPADRRPGEFQQLFRQDFDVPLIARFVFGRYWQAATPAQRQELLAVFENYLVSSYSDRLSTYANSGNAPIVIGSRPVEDGVLVSTKVILGRSPTQGGRGAPLAPIKVDWLLIEAGGTYKIIDVIVDGVSMATTQRLEFANDVQRQGGQLPALVAMLRERTASAAR